MKTLIAEDSLAARKLLETFLLEVGTCDVTVNGREAIDAFLQAIEAGEPARPVTYEFEWTDVWNSLTERVGTEGRSRSLRSFWGDTPMPPPGNIRRDYSFLA